MMAKSDLFLGGVPLAPEVRRLKERFGVPSVGSSITYEAISACLDGLSWRTKRWKAVTDRWRKDLFRDHNLVTEAVPGMAFTVQDSRGRLNTVGKTITRGCRVIKKAHSIGVTTPRAGLTSEEARALDHKVHVSATMIQVARTSQKELGAIPSLDVAAKKHPTPRAK